MAKREPNDKSTFGYSLFANEEKVLAEAENMIDRLEEVGKGVRALAQAYGKGFREQQRLVRLSDRMQEELQHANQSLAEQADKLMELNEALTVEILQRKALEEELRTLAVTDQLTGLATRRHFFELAEREFKKVARSHGPLSVLVMDLDHFKKVNDTRGHGAGDAALRIFGRTLLDSVREVDVAGRLGGEEFAVLLPETGRDEALVVAERIRAQVEAASISYQGKTFGITASVGLATLNEEDGGLERLLSRADRALYRAKGEGRNRVTVWTS